MRIGSLFSGIGGLELGLERSGIGNTVWQVEADPFCLAILERHWPDALRLDDVHHATRTTLPRVDLICGGFPCQDVSSAGSRVGLTGSRSGLWREFARIVSEVAPEWVVVENVASGAKLWLDAVVRDLEQRGYACLPLPLSAAGVGAPHLRKRIFVVAYRYGIGSGQGRTRGTSACGESGRSEGEEIAASRNTDAHREPALAEYGEVAKLRGASGPLTDADGESLRCSRLSRQAAGWMEGCPEPVLRRVDDGVPKGSHSDRLRALGNAVVPQCAEVVGFVIKELSRRITRAR